MLVMFVDFGTELVDCALGTRSAPISGSAQVAGIISTL
jgi:hypothetical protein